ncbi:MAG: terminase small subunit [Xanthobacteraceae bacterium]|jgi:hypothetical protein
MRQQLAPRDDEVPGSAPLKNPMFERLAREHASGMSMAQAFLAIGRKPDNAWRTFRRPAIQARVEYLRDEFNRMSGISLAAMQARLLRIADANATDLFETDEAGAVRLRKLTELPASASAAVGEIEVDGDVVRLKSVKLGDKVNALNTLIKTIGGFADTAVNVGFSLEALVQQSMQQREAAEYGAEEMREVNPAPALAPPAPEPPRPAGPRRVRV